MYNYKL